MRVIKYAENAVRSAQFDKIVAEIAANCVLNCIFSTLCLTLRFCCPTLPVVNDRLAVPAPAWKPGENPDGLAHVRQPRRHSNARAVWQARVGAKDGNNRKAGPG